MKCQGMWTGYVHSSRNKLFWCGETCAENSSGAEERTGLPESERVSLQSGSYPCWAPAFLVGGVSESHHRQLGKVGKKGSLFLLFTRPKYCWVWAGFPFWPPVESRTNNMSNTFEELQPWFFLQKDLGWDPSSCHMFPLRPLRPNMSGEFASHNWILGFSWDTWRSGFEFRFFIQGIIPDNPSFSRLW